MDGGISSGIYCVAISTLVRKQPYTLNIPKCQRYTKKHKNRTIQNRQNEKKPARNEANAAREKGPTKINKGIFHFYTQLLKH